ncbi:MAG: acyl-CoA thioesterase [Chthonomonas sp.]|nr:acyl-CoA thioesterase [Chthonomonas sp.]
MTGKTVTQTRSTLTQVVEPGHANFLGKMFGGALLSFIDLAAYTTASKFAGNICVTASFDRVDFHEPIEVGEVITLDGWVSYAGRTSVEVTIDVTSENILTGVRRETNQARVTMVAIKDGRPTPVPELVCETHDERLQYLRGKLRKERRFASRAEFDAICKRLEGLSQPQIEELMVAKDLMHHPIVEDAT